MGAEQLAAAHQKQQQRTAAAAASAIDAEWSRIDPHRIWLSWQQRLERVLAILTGAQLAAAAGADDYVSAALEEQNTNAAAAGAVNTDALAGIASDGRVLATLLQQPAIEALDALRSGAASQTALAGGRLHLDMIVRTQVADAGRVADGLALVAHRHTSGYVRMLRLPSCARCVILAGTWYRWNTGFERHPRCDCVHIPAAEDTDDLRTNPTAYFHSLSAADQDTVFTKAGAQAIRDGANIGQVVNARRGMQTASVLGRDVKITTTGTTRRSLAGSRLAREAGTRKVTGQRYRRAQAPRLMPEQIYADARRYDLSRDEVLRQLKRFGYIL